MLNNTVHKDSFSSKRTGTLRGMTGTYDFDFTSKPEILGVRLLSSVRNKGLLERVPHIEVCEGLALIADMVSGELHAVVTNDMLEGTGIPADDIFDAALFNMSFDRALLTDINDALSLPPDERENMLDRPAGLMQMLSPSMYILSNHESYWGAAALFYPGVMQKLSKLIGGDFYVLPSSVHELIILPVSDEADPQKLADTISAANSTVVSSEDFLSDYLYICRDGSLIRMDPAA